MTQRIRVLVADDHPLLREGIRRIFQDEPDMQVVGEACDGEQAVAMAVEHRPDVIVMDVNMPGFNGLEATKRIRSQEPSVQVIGLTVHENKDYFFHMLSAGAAGYLLKKDATSAELLGAVRSAHHEGVYLHPTMAKWLITDRLDKARGGTDNRVPDLTQRETEVLKLLAEGHSNQTIAAQLHISPTTVQTHRVNIMQKLDLHSRTDLVRYALRWGYVTLDNP